MANQEQLRILKEGAEVWNKWRKENNHKRINLFQAKIEGVNLRKSNLREANLSFAYLINMDLSGANFRKANLTGADLWGANLSNADFREADLSGSNLSVANLSGANLSETKLVATNLREVNLSSAILKNALIGQTIFGQIDISNTFGLEDVIHGGFSILDTHTIQFSKGKIPEVFLRGCGLADWEIESAKLYNPDLSNEEIVKIQYSIYDLRATQSIQISPLFISYSHADTAFVDKLEQGLNEKGVRFWRDIHDLKAGRIESQLDRAIRQNPTVLLILSKNSMNSDWVQHEVRKARKLEKELGRDALCPIALDDSWNTESNHWPQRMMEQVKEYNILDFSKWEDESIFQAEFGKLLNGLDVFYKKPEK